jgi:2-dehydropantoate 2-reductase
VRTLVFGAGAIGSLLGHRLASAGHNVTLIGRGATVCAVQAHGLLLEERSPARRTTHKVPVVTTTGTMDAAGRGRLVHAEAAERMEDIPADRRSWDLVVLTVKAYDTIGAAQDLAPHLPPDVPLLIVQNGVGGEELAREVLMRAEIISGVLTMSVSALAPGHIRLETSRGGLSLAPTRKGQHVQAWVDLFAAAGMRMATYHDHYALKWSKLLLNIQANAIPAILDMAPGEVFADPALFALERTAFLEAHSVMRALGLSAVSFPRYPVPLLVWAMGTLPPALSRPLLKRLVASGRGDKRPSLQMDLASGRQRSEIVYLNGAVVKYAEEVGLDVPVNRSLLDTLQGIASGEVPWAKFRHQPQVLLASVREATDQGTNRATAKTRSSQDMAAK